MSFRPAEDGANELRPEAITPGRKDCPVPTIRPYGRTRRLAPVAAADHLARAGGLDRATGVVGQVAHDAPVIGRAVAAIMGGCDTLKTSTGRFPVGATLGAAAVLLAVIEEADGRVGVKFSGGIRTTQQAAPYLFLVDHFLGSGWTSPDTLRFGASALLDDLLRILRPQ